MAKSFVSHPINSQLHIARVRNHVQALGDPDRIRSAAHAAGGHLAQIMRRRIAAGPMEHRDLADHIGTWDNGSDVAVGVHPDSPHAERFKNHEWGRPGVAPRPVMRQTVRNHARDAAQVFVKEWSR